MFAEYLCQVPVDELALALAAPRQMGKVVQNIEHAPLPIGTDHADGGVGCRKEEIFFQAQHLSSIGVNHTPMSKDQHSLPPVPASNLVNSCNHATAKLLRGLAARDRIPVAGTSGQAHNLRLPRLQGPGQS